MDFSGKSDSWVKLLTQQRMRAYLNLIEKDAPGKILQREREQVDQALNEHLRRVLK